MNEQFIEVATSFGVKKTIALSQISSMEPYLSGTRIVLKEMKDGNNVEITTAISYTVMNNTVFQLSKVVNG